MPQDTVTPTTPITPTVPPIITEENPTPPPSMDMSTGSAAPANDVLVNSVTNNDTDVMPSTVTTAPKKKFAGGKVIATILGLFLLVGGVGAGVFLTGQNQNIAEKADDSGYRIEKICTKEGENRRWCLDSVVDCPNDHGAPIDCGTLENLGWKCSGNETEPCAGTGGGGGGTNEPNPSTAQCKDNKAYTTAWVKLSNSDLANLKVGDSVNFCVSGTSTGAGSFNKARFKINGTEMPITTDKRPGSDDFCQIYTIPAGVTTFNVKAEINHSNLGWK